MCGRVSICVMGRLESGVIGTTVLTSEMLVQSPDHSPSLLIHSAF